MGSLQLQSRQLQARCLEVIQSFAGAGKTLSVGNLECLLGTKPGRVRNALEALERDALIAIEPFPDAQKHEPKNRIKLLTAAGKGVDRERRKSS